MLEKQLDNGLVARPASPTHSCLTSMVCYIDSGCSSKQEPDDLVMAISSGQLKGSRPMAVLGINVDVFLKQNCRDLIQTEASCNMEWRDPLGKAVVPPAPPVSSYVQDLDGSGQLPDMPERAEMFNSPPRRDVP
jgi:hypothetical protein